MSATRADSLSPTRTEATTKLTGATTECPEAAKKTEEVEDEGDERSRTRLPVVYDTIIVGAGPCGLAVAARLREHTPSALFTDAEHNRYHWIRKHGSRAAIRNTKNGRTTRSGGGAGSGDASPSSLLVLDSSGSEWLSRWRKLFGWLEISHLRSPMFFHPDPHDRDGLLAYAHACGRSDECVEIANCVGRELSKHQTKKKRQRQHGERARAAVTIDERDRKDYFAPPSDLFEDYCAGVALRYGLEASEQLLRHASVDSIDYTSVPELLPSHEKLCVLRTSSDIFYARTVVLAVGAGNGPSVPPPFAPDVATGRCPAACHAFEALDAPLMSRLTKSKQQQQRHDGGKQSTNVLVVGGGLTSAQVVDRAVRKGATKVWHVMRSEMKVKPFDVDLGWMGKFRNHEKAAFWSADDDEERAELVRSARGGGSITPRFARIVEQHVRAGRVCLRTNTTVTSASFDGQKQTWSVSISTSPARSCAEAKSLEQEELPPIHFIYFATGVQSDVDTLPLLRKLATRYPIETYDGLPALTDDLQWTESVPLFVTGRLAALRLGPGAGNLEGARLGAERIAWALGDVLGEGQKRSEGDESESENGDDKKHDVERYAAGIGSRFEALADME